MDSHIQMPKCILKEFVNKEKFFYKFNAENSMINVGFPKKTFTSEDYYAYGGHQRQLVRRLTAAVR